MVISDAFVSFPPLSRRRITFGGGAVQPTSPSRHTFVEGLHIRFEAAYFWFQQKFGSFFSSNGMTTCLRSQMLLMEPWFERYVFRSGLSGSILALKLE